jgi:hypothetical protein
LSFDELHAAREALDDGNFEQARHHLNNARIAGADERRLAELFEELNRREFSQDRQKSGRMFFAICVAVLGYTVLSFRQPAAWSPELWIALAFLLIPVLAGALAGNSVAATSARVKGKRFWRGFWVAFITMGLYTLINVAIVRSRVTSADKADDLTIFLVVTVAYGFAAGIVAGFAGVFMPAKPRST